MLVLHLVWSFALISMAAAWAVVAAVLKPTAYLPHAVAVLSVVIFCSMVGENLIRTAKNLSKAIAAGIQRGIDAKLITAVGHMEQEVTWHLLEPDASSRPRHLHT